MATINQVLRGLEVFAKTRGDHFDVAAEHDIFLVQCDGSQLSDDDTRILEANEWFQSEEFGCWAIYT